MKPCKCLLHWGREPLQSTYDLRGLSLVPRLLEGGGGGGGVLVELFSAHLHMECSEGSPVQDTHRAHEC